jgi:hypothetical protein
MNPETTAQDLIAAHVGPGNVVADPWALYAALVDALKEAAGRGLYRMPPVTLAAEPVDLPRTHQEASP